MTDKGFTLDPHEIQWMKKGWKNFYTIALKS